MIIAFLTQQELFFYFWKTITSKVIYCPDKKSFLTHENSLNYYNELITQLKWIRDVQQSYLLGGGEKDLDRERADLRGGDRLRLRLIGDLLGLRARLGGELWEDK